MAVKRSEIDGRTPVSTGPCYGCGVSPVAISVERDGLKTHGASIVVCRVCSFGICWECVAVSSHRADEPATRKPSERPCCDRAVREGWPDKISGFARGTLADEGSRRAQVLVSA